MIYTPIRSIREFEELCYQIEHLFLSVIQMHLTI